MVIEQIDKIDVNLAPQKAMAMYSDVILTSSDVSLGSYDAMSVTMNDLFGLCS